MMKHLVRTTSLTVLAAGLIGAACAQESPGRSIPSDAAQPAPPGGPPTTVAVEAVEKLPYLVPHGGPPGTKVSVTMSNLLLGDSVEVGFGSFVEHQILAYGHADKDGGFKTTIAIPADATPGTHYFFIANSTGSPVAVSDPFLVTRADGTIRLRGQITDAGAECKLMKGVNDEVYGLAGKVGGPAVGAHVTVDGKLASSSPCKQPLAIEVTSLQVDP